MRASFFRRFLTNCVSDLDENNVVFLKIAITDWIQEVTVKPRVIKGQKREVLLTPLLRRFLKMWMKLAKKLDNIFFFTDCFAFSKLIKTRIDGHTKTNRCWEKIILARVVFSAISDQLCVRPWFEANTYLIKLKQNFGNLNQLNLSVY